MVSLKAAVFVFTLSLGIGSHATSIASWSNHTAVQITKTLPYAPASGSVVLQEPFSVQISSISSTTSTATLLSSVGSTTVGDATVTDFPASMANSETLSSGTSSLPASNSSNTQEMVSSSMSGFTAISSESVLSTSISNVSALQQASDSFWGAMVPTSSFSSISILISSDVSLLLTASSSSMSVPAPTSDTVSSTASTGSDASSSSGTAIDFTTQQTDSSISEQATTYANSSSAVVSSTTSLAEVWTTVPLVIPVPSSAFSNAATTSSSNPVLQATSQMPTSVDAVAPSSVASTITMTTFVTTRTVGYQETSFVTITVSTPPATAVLTKREVCTAPGGLLYDCGPVPPKAEPIEWWADKEAVAEILDFLEHLWAHMPPPAQQVAVVPAKRDVCTTNGLLFDCGTPTKPTPTPDAAAAAAAAIMSILQNLPPPPPN
ncbi:unnamed protein product [Zymoseptoria tritici ST99CH_1A5]|uniref:Ig-like domain-containing protein n=1 Tax=Zymoseptoria tritici ST99CH_1A5 TaxID=1276529 RepID=A0A1Y6L619_ZYMTR|nr:unnamed protein product [Zymoseptoria tritici ST99CH_1A5]